MAGKIFCIDLCKKKQNVFYTCLKKYNALPLILKETHSVSEFKRFLKNYLVQN